MTADNGLASLNRRLKAIPKAAREAVQPALKKAGDDLAKDVAHLAERARDSGDLIKSIAVTTAGNQTPPYSQPGGGQVVPENQVLVTVGNTAVRYGHMVEYGTAPHENRGEFAGTQHPGTEAQPFFWPAFRLNRKKLANRIKRAVGKAVKSEVKAK
ncbi:HK97-gp10 family putative phage morphogenesis protein [Xanthobacter autotrophicus]|uniref:HK97-gp10 family putative phage morphogenesis protein n=1 Tax=Xanthobacter autotrophicus TaxID=280 RepID=UPI00372BED08